MEQRLVISWLGACFLMAPLNLGILETFMIGTLISFTLYGVLKT